MQGVCFCVCFNPSLLVCAVIIAVVCCGLQYFKKMTGQC